MSENNKPKRPKIPGFDLLVENHKVASDTIANWVKLLTCTSLPSSSDIDPETDEYVVVPLKYDAHYYAFFGEDNPNAQSSKANNYNSYKTSKDSTSKKAAWQSSSYKKNSTTKPAMVEGDCSQPNKYRKTVTGVRKELFRVPVVSNKKLEQPTQVSTSNACVRRTPIERYQPSKIPSTKPRFTSMKTITESHVPVPEQLGRTRTPSKYLFRPAAVRSVKSPATSDDVNNAQQDSMSEFLTLEQQCLSVKKSALNRESQISTICNLFQNSMLIDATEGNAPAKNILSEIRGLINLEQTRLEASLQAFLEQNRSSKANLQRLSVLVAKLEQQIGSQDDEDKENALRRRSPGLKNKNSNLTVPLINIESCDLRKATLTKSLKGWCQNDHVDSTPPKRTQTVYTATENSCSVLLTPKVSKGPLLEVPTNSAVRYLTVKIRDQYMMLQDTPARK